mgnify:FL=1
MDIKRKIKEEKNLVIRNIYKEIEKSDYNLVNLTTKWLFYCDKYKYINPTLSQVYKLKLKVLLNLLINDRYILT